MKCLEFAPPKNAPRMACPPLCPGSDGRRRTRMYVDIVHRPKLRLPARISLYQSSGDHPPCDDKEGHYIIVPDDMISRRCESWSLFAVPSFFLTPVQFRPDCATPRPGNIQQGCGGR